MRRSARAAAQNRKVYVDDVEDVEEDRSDKPTRAAKKRQRPTQHSESDRDYQGTDESESEPEEEFVESEDEYKPSKKRSCANRAQRARPCPSTSRRTAKSATAALETPLSSTNIFECSVCCEEINPKLGGALPVGALECPSCHFTACSHCQRRQDGDPVKCMSCKTSIPRELCEEVLGKKFVHVECRKRMLQVLMQEQRGRLEGYAQSQLAQERERRKAKKELRFGKSIVQFVNKKKTRGKGRKNTRRGRGAPSPAEKESENEADPADTLLGAADEDLDDEEGGEAASTAGDDAVVQTVLTRASNKQSAAIFVAFPCPVTTCRGRITDTKGLCIVCNTTVCTKCREVKAFEHKCDPSTVETVQMLVKQACTKPCPRCQVLIFHSSGCDHMHCTNCGVFFNWSNLKITQGSSNHHYRQTQLLSEEYRSQQLLSHQEQSARVPEAIRAQPSLTTLLTPEDMVSEYAVLTDLQSHRAPTETDVLRFYRYQRKLYLLPRAMLTSLFHTTTAVQQLLQQSFDITKVELVAQRRHDQLLFAVLDEGMADKDWEQGVYTMHCKSELSRQVGQQLDLFVVTMRGFARELIREFRDIDKAAMAALCERMDRFVAECNKSLSLLYWEYQRAISADGLIATSAAQCKALHIRRLLEEGLPPVVFICDEKLQRLLKVNEGELHLGDWECSLPKTPLASSAASRRPRAASETMIHAIVDEEAEEEETEDQRAREIELMDYQSEHVARLQAILAEKPFGVDLSPLGTGKTFTSAFLAKSDFLGVKHVVVVAPKSVVPKWCDVLDRLDGSMSKALFTYQGLAGVQGHQPLAPFLFRNDCSAGVLLSAEMDEFASNQASPAGLNGVLANTSNDDFVQFEFAHRWRHNRKSCNFFTTPLFARLLREGVLLIFDEIQEIKNESSLTRACRAMCQGVFDQFYATRGEGGEAEREREGAKSRFLFLSGSPIDKDEQIITFLRNCGVYRARALYSQDNYELFPLGIKEIEDFCLQVSPALCEDPQERVDKIRTKAASASSVDFENSREFYLKYCKELFLNFFLKTFSSSMPVLETSSEHCKKIAKINGKFQLDAGDRDSLMEGVGKLAEAEQIQQLSGSIGKLSREQQQRVLKLKMEGLIIVETAKIPLFVRLAVQQLEKGDHKVVLAVNFTNTIKDLCAALSDYRPLTLDGSKSIRARQDILQKFQAPSMEHPLLIANMRVISSGIDLDDKHGGFKRICYASPNFLTISLYQLSHRFVRGLSTKSDAELVQVYVNGLDLEMHLMNKLSKKGKLMKVITPIQVDGGIVFPCDFPTLIEDANGNLQPEDK